MTSAVNPWMIMDVDDSRDNYAHINSNILYVEENIPSKLKKDDPESLRIHSEYNSQQTIHCICTVSCTEKEMCQCLFSRENNYKKIDFELVATDSTLSKDKPIIECNSLCSCKINCSNRLVQLGPRKHLSVLKCHGNVNIEGQEDPIIEANKGLGLFTEEPIPRGGFVCEYAGEILSKKEAFERTKHNKENSLMNYIICVNEHTGANKLQTFIDPSQFGNIGRYMNHSCYPNCVMIPVRVDNPIPKLCLFALENIEAGAELTFDYGSKRKDVNFEPNFDVQQRIKCFCGNKCCKKWLPYDEFEI